MADRSASASPSAADGAVAVARLEAMSSDVRGCAILGPGGEPLATSGEGDDWVAAATAFLAAADVAAGEAVTQIHVGNEDGEAFALRHGGCAIVVASQRFALASLMFSDMRAVLRDLVRGPAAARPAPRRAAA